MSKDIVKKILLAGTCMVFICGCLSGCSPAMRKKFVRQKKQEEDLDFVPVLEPVEYPNRIESSKKRYEYFYALLKVWQKDALILIDDEHSDKQMTYTINQIRVQLEEMKKILEGNGLQKAIEGEKYLNAILAFYDRPEAFRNHSIIRKKIQKITDVIIKPLAFENIKGDVTF